MIGVFGTGRNGSTLLARLLDGIPGAYVHAVECNFLSAIDSLYENPYVEDIVNKNATTRRLQWLCKPVLTERLLRYYAFHKSEIENDILAQMEAGEVALGEPPFAGLAARPQWKAQEFVGAFLRAFSAWLQPETSLKLAIFKSIETPYIEDYERLFPEMRFIHIVRDPVDMWSSQKRSVVIGKSRPPWYIGLDNLTSSIAARWVPHARLILARRHDPRHYVLRYEDLTADADKAMSGLFAWLGGEMPKEPTVQTLLGGRHPKKLIRFSSQPGVETPRTVVGDMGKRHNYADLVTDRERQLIRLATWSLGRELGYGLNETRPDPAAVRSAWWHLDRSDFGPVHGLRDAVLTLRSVLKRRWFVWNVCRQGGA